jgi:hypothetical protein
MRRTVAAVSLVVAGGCQTDHAFETVAVYEAPRSACAIRIQASGVVPAGHDVTSEARGTLVLGPQRSAERGGRPVAILPIALREGRVEVTSSHGEQGNAASRDHGFLSRLVAEAGCWPAAAEVEELATAIEGVLRGPKTTLMEGQSRALRVVSTTFDRPRDEPSP